MINTTGYKIILLLRAATGCIRSVSFWTQNRFRPILRSLMVIVMMVVMVMMRKSDGGVSTFSSHIKHFIREEIYREGSRPRG